MKILFLHKWLVIGGIERILINYLKLLSNNQSYTIELLMAYDIENNVFHSEIPSDIKVHYLFDNEEFRYGISVYNNRKNSLKCKVINKCYRIKEKYLCRRNLNRFIVDNNYDIVINFSDHFDNYIQFNCLNIPILRWQHSAPSANEKFSEKKVKILSQYSKIITICNEMKNEMIRITHLSQNKFTMLFNPVGVERIKKLSNEKVEKEIKDKEYVIQVARLDKAKRHSELIKIYHELCKQGIKEKLYILGGGEEFDNLKDLINELGLSDKCILLGEIKNPYPYMKNAKLFLHTSEREGLPTVLLESLILNTPVISTDCPTGPREILSLGAGRLVPLYNDEEFIKMAFELLTCPEKLDECKKKIPETLSYFSEENIRDCFINLLSDMRENKL